MRHVISEQSIPISLNMNALSMEIPIIWVNDFEPENVKAFFTEFMALQSDDFIKETFIFVDSFGGSVDGLCAMTELIESTTKPVSTVCIGKAMSAGGLLTAIGTPGHRWIGPNSRIMLHRVSTSFDGDSEMIQTLTKELIRMNDMWLKKAVSRSNLNWKEFNQKLHDNGGEWYLSPKEAIEFGFADRIGIPVIKEIRSIVVDVDETVPSKKKSLKKKPKKKTAKKAKEK